MAFPQLKQDSSVHCSTYEVLADGENDFYSSGSDGLIKIAMWIKKINLNQGAFFYN